MTTSDPWFSRMLTASVALHLAVLFAFTVRTYLFPQDEINYEDAIRVDLVALPDKFPALAEPQKATAATPMPMAPAKPKETAKDKAPKVDLKSKKKAEREALDKIKAMEALENISKEVKTDEKNERLKNAQAKGNILSKGSALKGIASNQLSGYVHELKKHVTEHWSLPQWLADLDLKATAIVFLDQNGVVTQRSIIKPSGNETYDNLILTTIDQASPFPPPPQTFVDLVKVKGIQLGFPQ